MLTNLITRIKRFLENLFHKNRKTETRIYNVPPSPIPFEPDVFKATKAYADQRQKQPHNRRQKPSKSMKNLYKLG